MTDTRINYWYMKAMKYKLGRSALATILLVSLVVNVWLVLELFAQ